MRRCSSMIALVLLTACPTQAVAQQAALEHDEGPFTVRAEIGAGGMLPDYQRASLRYDVVLGGAVRPALRIFGPLLVQLSYETLIAPSSAGDGEQQTVAGGLRFEPRVASSIWVFADANAGLAITGGDPRFGMTFGLGLELGLHPLFSIGPYVRYAHTFAAAEDHPSDAMILLGGVALSLRTLGAERAGRPADRDGDGITDADDLCVETAASDRPDPQRAGCPITDADGDDIPDRDDVCPAQAAGDDPDPDRSGCPSIDTDGDGVADHADACATTPAGETPDPERRGCPDGDDDGDGVRNALDACRTAHRGVHPDPARPGCPLPDRDHDSIADAVDHCPDEAGAPHLDPERNGCPGLVRIEGRRIVILQPVFFATNRDRILPRSRPVLQAVADALRASPEIRRVSIEGHTDDIGEEDANLDLSRRRANNVMAWLIQNGVEASRLEAHGLGESRPLVEDTTEDARATNRRVEFNVIDRVGDPEGGSDDTALRGGGEGLDR